MNLYYKASSHKEALDVVAQVKEITGFKLALDYYLEGLPIVVEVTNDIRIHNHECEVDSFPSLKIFLDRVKAEYGPPWTKFKVGDQVAFKGEIMKVEPAEYKGDRTILIKVKDYFEVWINHELITNVPT
jgi:hypothetical protein